MSDDNWPKPTNLRCVACGQDFDFPLSEQTYYREHGLNQPKRCKQCRNAAKSLRTEREKSSPNPEKVDGHGKLLLTILREMGASSVVVKPETTDGYIQFVMTADLGRDTGLIIGRSGKNIAALRTIMDCLGKASGCIYDIDTSGLPQKAEP